MANYGDDEEFLTGDGEEPVAPHRTRRSQLPHRGALVLTFGILGLVCCIIFGILAWVWGNEDLRRMKAGEMDREGQGLTEAGRICGIIGVALNIVGIIGYAIVFALALGSSGGVY
ncbi:MAG: hypothetical protein O2894_03540 [Planctomycetota bacterium]|nr:hypothetical protein [Planctomycetota bacterium]